MNKILEIKNLSVSYDSTKALDNFSLTLNEGEIVAVLGQICAGKSTLAKSIIRLLPLNAKVEFSKFTFLCNDLYDIEKKNLQKIRGSGICLIPENSQNALNPVVKISTQIEEVLISKKGLNRKDAKIKALELLRQVDLSEARFNSYPGELSGGQKQRVVIAIALALEPKLLLCDEITSALDVTLQTSILNLLNKFRLKYKTSIILFTSDLFVATSFSNRLILLKHGKTVEESESSSFIKSAKEPYSREYISKSLSFF